MIFETSISKCIFNRNSIVVHNPKMNIGNYKINNNLHKINDEKTYKGEVTAATKKRIRKAVEILNIISEWKITYNPIIKSNYNYRLTFITLTIPWYGKSVNHKLAYEKLLKPFIRICKDKFKMVSYIWKAELQKNTQIHYHITTNIFVRADLIRHQWNILLRKNNLLKEYAIKYKNYNPPSTSIEKVRNDKDIEIYLSKYIAKNADENFKINGKVWDCSINLKIAKKFSITMYPYHVTALKELYKKSLELEFEHDYFTYMKFNEETAPFILFGLEHKLFDDWKKSILTASNIIKKPRVKLVAATPPLAKIVLQPQQLQICT